MKYYGISGLGADYRVFNYLKLKYPLEVLEWIAPEKDEDIKSYAIRLASMIRTDEDFGMIGVSFGGLVATEISKMLKPKITILISSVEVRDELSLAYRIAGRINLLKIFPTKFFDLPKKVAFWLFGAQNKSLLSEILDDTDLSFTKWAAIELTSWDNEQRLTNVLKIHGSKDKVIPLVDATNSHVIVGGQHFMIVDKAEEVSTIINRICESLG